VVLLVNLSPRLRVNGEQTLPSFFNGNRALSREMVSIELVLISLSIPLGFRSYDCCDFRLKGIPVKGPLR